MEEYTEMGGSPRDEQDYVAIENGEVVGGTVVADLDENQGIVL
jgi:hypothetical protein